MRKTLKLLPEALVSLFYARYWNDSLLSFFPAFMKLNYGDGIRLAYTDRPNSCFLATVISEKWGKAHARIKKEASLAATREALVK